MEEVVRYTAGVRAEMYGPDNRGDWFTLRGGSEGSTVLDGMRLPLSGWWGNVRNEPYAFERVEVLRGTKLGHVRPERPGRRRQSGLQAAASEAPDGTSPCSSATGRTSRSPSISPGPLGTDRRLLYRFVALAKDSGTQVDHADDAATVHRAVAHLETRHRAPPLTMYGAVPA